MHHTVLRHAAATLMVNTEVVRQVLAVKTAGNQTLVLSYELVDGALVGTHAVVSDDETSRLAFTNLESLTSEWREASG